MRIILLLTISLSFLFAIETSDKLFECTEIFKQRKNELLVELERIDEQRQALSALKIATEDLLKKKEQNLSKKEESVNNKLSIVTQKEQNIKDMLDKNKKILSELKTLKMNKIAQTFAKMKAAAASNILSDMDIKEAVSILRSLKPKTVGQILTKMDPKKASKITLLLAN
jgi:flagellar motility protein MotE (MotC chaperone)